MAIINCPECGHEVSDQAKSCPSCGVSIKKFNDKFVRTKAIILAIVIVTIITSIISIYVHWQSEKIQEQYREDFWNSDTGHEISKIQEDIERRGGGE